MTKLILALPIALLFSGCAITPDTNIKTSVSTFDGSKSITTAPNVIDCVNITVCAYMSLTWTNKQPEIPVLMIKLEDTQAIASSYYPIISAKFNVDGNIVSLKPLPGGDNNFNHSGTSKSTTRLFEAPMALLKSIEKSNDTKIQILADGAIVEKDFKNGTAYPAMTKFIGEVEQNK